MNVQELVGETPEDGTIFRVSRLTGREDLRISGLTYLFAILPSCLPVTCPTYPQPSAPLPLTRLRHPMQPTDMLPPRGRQTAVRPTNGPKRGCTRAGAHQLVIVCPSQ